jgi:hypothetical protein
MKYLIIALFALLLASCDMASKPYTKTLGTVTFADAHLLEVFCPTGTCGIYNAHASVNLLSVGDSVYVYDCKDRLTDDCGIYELGLNSVPAIVKIVEIGE